MLKKSVPMLKQSFSSHFSSISSEGVLSDKNKSRTVDVLKSLHPIIRTKMISKRRAAVLVPLCKNEDKISMLFTVRSMSLRNNRGQVAFPGGMEDLDDKSLLDTALRETEEEIGLHRKDVEVWGPGPAVGREDMMVSPFLAYVGSVDPKSFEINKDEVDAVFTVPLASLCRKDSFKTTEFRSRKGNYVLPVFVTPELRIWGLTALITHTVLHALLPQDYRNVVQRHLLSSDRLPSTFIVCLVVAMHGFSYTL